MQARGLVEEWCARSAASRATARLANCGDCSASRRRCEAIRSRSSNAIGSSIERSVVAAGNPFVADFYESLRDRQLRMGLHVVVNFAGTRMDIVLGEHARSSTRSNRAIPTAPPPRSRCIWPRRSPRLRSPGKIGWKRGGGSRQEPIRQRRRFRELTTRGEGAT